METKTNKDDTVVEVYPPTPKFGQFMAVAGLILFIFACGLAINLSTLIEYTNDYVILRALIESGNFDCAEYISSLNLE